MGRGVFLIRNDADLDAYTHDRHVAYIQQYLPIDRDIRVVVIGSRVIHAYWRIAGKGEFRTNVAIGGAHQPGFGTRRRPLPWPFMQRKPAGGTTWAWTSAATTGSTPFLEANMKYGKEGFRAAGIDYFQMMERMIDDGQI
jgi:ribosomal protein S6--L-glutamate ligase